MIQIEMSESRVASEAEGLPAELIASLMTSLLRGVLIVLLFESFVVIPFLAVNKVAASWMSVFASVDVYKYGTFDSNIIASDDFTNSYNVGIKLTWPIFDGGLTLARKAEADLAAKQTHEGITKLLTELPLEVDNWKRRYSYNKSLVNARKRSVELSEESLRLATLASKAGSRTDSEVLDAEHDLFRSRAGVIRAEIDALAALINLELCLGHRI